MYNECIVKQQYDNQNILNIITVKFLEIWHISM
jgi:hypothetical protein